MGDVEYINVKSARDDDRVAFYERDDRHPADVEGNHDVFVAGPLVVRVARTPNVEVALRDGRLMKTDEPLTPTALPENVSRTPPLSQEGPEGLREARKLNVQSQEAMDAVEPPTAEDVEASKKEAVERANAPTNTPPDTRPSDMDNEAMVAGLGPPDSAPKGNKK